MRLILNPTNEIFFKKSSDETMKGFIQVTNPTSDTLFAFKIKCTNPDLFIVTPLSGIIKSGQKTTIQFNTNDPVNPELARQLASKHKFLLEFAPVTSQLAVPNFRSHQSDRKKYYINMDNIRGSNIVKDVQKVSMQSAISNKMSYLSMKNDQKPRSNSYATPRKNMQEKQFARQSPMKTTRQNQQLHQKYSKLKQELEDLHRQRQDIINKMSTTSKAPSFNVKKIVVIIVFFLIGTFVGNYFEKVVEGWKVQAEIERKRQQQQKQQQQDWSIFSIFDFLYDEVDPQKEDENEEVEGEGQEES